MSDRSTDTPTADYPARSTEASSRPLRVALVVVLAVAWVNLLTTGRWAEEPGALHGWRFPWYLAFLAAATAAAAAWFGRWRDRPIGNGFPILVAAGGIALLTSAFISAFPPSTWTHVPFYDDWPGLVQLTANGVDLLTRGAVAGWNWAFLGGYHTSSDLSQSLALTAYLPFRLFGPEIGFHLLLAVFTFLVPLGIYLDMRLQGNRRETSLAVGLACLLTAGYFATIMRSGMANSVAGVGFAGLALAGSHAAHLGRRWGGPLMVGALTLILYSHAAFFLYTAVFLGLEALFYRSWRTAVRSGAALGIAFVGGSPLLWELYRYPEFFRTNNLYWEPPPGFDWAGFSRNVYYAAEILVQPWRWFNDYVGAAHVWLAAVVAVAVKCRSRAGFYAWATLATVAMLRLNTPQLGIILARELYLYPLLLAPALAAFVIRLPRAAAVAATLVLGFFVAVPFEPVWHETSVSAFNGPLVDRIHDAPGDMVLIENSPHWNMIATPGQRSARPLVSSHYESLLPAATGKRFFAQAQDGYHRSTFRDRVLAGGAYRGRAIADTQPDTFASELRRWGVTRLFVWSDPSTRYLDGSALFSLTWQQGPWREYELVDADPRQVVVESGRGTLVSYDGLSGTIALDDVRRGAVVVVRTNYFPAWRASAGGTPVELFNDKGQLAFLTPADGTYQVHLEYPSRAGWLFLAWLVVGVGAVALSLVGRGPGRARHVPAAAAQIS